MAGIAGVCRQDMSDLLPLGDSTVVTGRACTDDLGMVHPHDGLKCCRGVAVGASRRRIDMRRRFALCDRPVVAG